MSKPALTIDKYTSMFKQWGLNLTSIKVLAAYCKDHPNKPGVILNDSLKQFNIDPFVKKLREKDRIKALFDRFNLYGIVLTSTDSEKYSFIGRYKNGTMLTITVDKTKNGYHVPFLIAIVFMIEKISDDYKLEQTKQNQLEKNNLDYVLEDKDSQLTQKEVSSEEVNTETVDFLNKGSFSRQVNFSDLPKDLQELIFQTIPSPQVEEK